MSRRDAKTAWDSTATTVKQCGSVDIALDQRTRWRRSSPLALADLPADPVPAYSRWPSTADTSETRFFVLDARNPRPALVMLGYWFALQPLDALPQVGDATSGLDLLRAMAGRDGPGQWVRSAVW